MRRKVFDVLVSAGGAVIVVPGAPRVGQAAGGARTESTPRDRLPSYRRHRWLAEVE